MGEIGKKRGKEQSSEKAREKPSNEKFCQGGTTRWIWRMTCTCDRLWVHRSNTVVHQSVVEN